MSHSFPFVLPLKRHCSAALLSSVVLSLLGSLCACQPSGSLSASSPDQGSSAAAAPAGGPLAKRAGPSQVPTFSLVEDTGRRLDSDDWIGQRAFVMVFFATWCEACARKLAAVQRGRQGHEAVDLLLVSVDGPRSLPHVPGFLREQRLGGEGYVRGLEDPSFLSRYNPTSSIPLVVVVGADGALVDYQVGLTPGEEGRLAQALSAAESSADSWSAALAGAARK